MKQKINVIDLDKTLIPFDSFKKLVINHILKCDFNIIIVSFLRFSRLISASCFKKKIIDIFEAKPSISKTYINFAEIILKNINEDVIAIIRNNSKENEIINILCSASPKGYVQIIANKFGWIGYGSGYYNNKFINMFGQQKLAFIEEKYPIDKYKYNFAISDSKSDLNLLKLFDNYKLLKK